MSWIIDSVFVNDDGPDQSTELDQRVPVAAVTRESGSLDRENGADAPFADCRQQAFEAEPVDAAARAAEIIVDDLDRVPAELPGTVGHPLLPAVALLIVQELVRRRLPDIDEVCAVQMLNRDLAHRWPPRLPAPLRFPEAGLPPALPTVPSVMARASWAARSARTDPAETLRFWASWLSFSIPDSDRRKVRTASISERRDRRISRESRGSSRSSVCAAVSRVIQAGMQATDPSSCGMTINSVPR